VGELAGPSAVLLLLLRQWCWLRATPYGLIQDMVQFSENQGAKNAANAIVAKQASLTQMTCNSDTKVSHNT